MLTGVKLTAESPLRATSNVSSRQRDREGKLQRTAVLLLSRSCVSRSITPLPPEICCPSFLRAPRFRIHKVIIPTSKVSTCTSLRPSKLGFKCENVSTAAEKLLTRIPSRTASRWLAVRAGGGELNGGGRGQTHDVVRGGIGGGGGGRHALGLEEEWLQETRARQWQALVARRQIREVSCKRLYMMSGKHTLLVIGDMPHSCGRVGEKSKATGKSNRLCTA